MPKPLNYTGIVKFKGKLNPEKYDARIHVGVRMDEPGRSFYLVNNLRYIALHFPSRFIIIIIIIIITISSTLKE